MSRRTYQDDTNRTVHHEIIFLKASGAKRVLVCATHPIFYNHPWAEIVRCVHLRFSVATLFNE
jgi:phosphoribosylpyrophosphate synthetase